MENPENVPAWAIRLQEEIDELKRSILKANRSQWDYFDFINRFRKHMMPDPDRNHFPEVIVGKRRIGVTLDGLLYDKETGNTLNRMDAFRIYSILYRDYTRKRNR
jgi:hypothetical protein